MAFQKQFKTNYFSYNGWEYYMEIWVNTTAGTITTSEVKLGTGGPIISYDTDNEDRFSPIISSNCVIPLVIESSIQETFVKQLREVYNERDVYVHLYRATEAQHSTVKPLWSGFVLMDLSSTPDEFYPYDFKITAVDGLGLLKDIDFVKPTTRRANEYIQADMYYGPGRFTYWLKEILLKTGASTTVEGSSQDYEFTTAINWYESQMPNTSQSTDPFYITKCSVGMFHTKTDDGVYEVTNCYEVLKELLKHWGARITYWKGQFWIVQIPQYITPDSGTYINPDNVNTRTYDKSGTFIGSSDNLGDSYWTRYQLNIGDIDGGIQKLTGTNVNYLPQIREVRANNISFGGGNRYGGFPREFAGNSAPDEIIFQDQINDASDSDSFNLVIPLNVTVQNGNPFFMKILFNFYCTDLTNTYYLQYDTTLTHKYYWVDVSQWTTLVKAPTWDSGFISPATGNSNQSQSHSNLEGFNQNILFKLYNTSTQIFSDLDLSGDYKFYLDIDAYGTNISNPGSFRFKLANAGPSGGQFFYPTHPSIDVTWTNTLQSNYSLQTPNIITNNAPNGNSIIQLTTPNIDPFEGMFVVITNTTGSIYGNSYVSSVNTSDVAIVDFGTLIFGDTLQISDLGSLQVYNGSTFVKSSSSGNWGVGILTGSLAFTQILLDEYLYGQTVVIESPSMRLVTSEVNKQSSDGSGLRPNYVNPIGRLKESRTNLADVQYVFKRGAFYTLTDEWDYDGFEIKRNVDTIVKTTKNITGPNNPVTGVGSVPKTTTVPNAFGQVISKQIITSISSSVAAGTITSLPIALINDVIFKIGDYFNVLNSDTNEFIKFELNGQQFSDSSSLTVVSQVIADNIPANSIITFNAFDLTSQYQNKTRGTVGAFDITATSIDSGSVAISSYIDDDTFATASVNSLATSESIKAYVDGQAGLTENFQTVTDNGNTTTNSIMIGSSTSPSEKLEVVGNIVTTQNITLGNNNDVKFKNSVGNAVGVLRLNSSNELVLFNGNSSNGHILFVAGNVERMRSTPTGLGIGTTSPSNALEIGTTGTTGRIYFSGNTGGGGSGILYKDISGQARYGLHFEDDNKVILSNRAVNGTVQIRANTSSSGAGGEQTIATFEDDQVSIDGNLGINTSSPTEKLHVVGDALITGDSHADAFKPAVAANPIKFKNFGSTEVGRFTDSGQLLVGLTSSSNIVAFKDVADIEFDLDGSDAAMNFNSIWRTGVRASASSFRFAESNISLGTNVRMTIETGGQITLPSYGSGTFTGAETYFLAVTSSGDVVEADSSALPGGPYLPLTGGTLTGSLTGTSATFSGVVIIGSATGLTNATRFVVSDTNGAGLEFIPQTIHDRITLLSYNRNTSAYQTLDISSLDIHFNISGSEKARITSGGSLLLGTTTDSAKLTVDSSTSDTVAVFKSSDSTARILIQDNDTTNYIVSNNSTLSLGANNTLNSGNLNINADGNVGIGTNSSGTFLQLGSYAVAGKYINQAAYPDIPSEHMMHITAPSTTAYYGGGISFGETAFTAANIVVRDAGGGGALDLCFGTGNNTGVTEKMRIAHNGNVGIGTTSPVTKLELKDSSATVGLSITAANNAYSDINLGDVDDINIQRIRSEHSSESLLFYTNNAERLRINNAGNVGIGTSSPAFKTTIYSSLNTDSFPLVVGQPNSANNFVGIGLSGFVASNGAVKGAMVLERVGIYGVGNLHFLNNSDLDNSNATIADSKLAITSAGAIAFGGAANYGTAGQILQTNANASPTWVDASSVIGGPYLPLTGGTLTGSLTGTTATFSGDISLSGHIYLAVNKYIFSNNNPLIGGISNQTEIYGINNVISFYSGAGSQYMTIKSGNVIINSTSDNGAKLQVTGIIRTTGGSVQAGQDYGFTLQDESNNNRYGLKFGAAGSVGGSNLLMLTNRSLSSATGGGEVAIGANASTSGVTETEVMRIKANTQSEVSIDGILSLTVQDTPADPSNNKSSIWLDSNWDLKIKITNSSGDTVTKTIVEYA